MLKQPRAAQLGFSLIEFAIVLVIIGLLLGSILKTQPITDSAKVKSLLADFKQVPLYIGWYQDRYRAMPGDDRQAVLHLGNAAGVPNQQNAGSGTIEGAWNSNDVNDESILFWQHLRLAGLIAGSTDRSAAQFLPSNVIGGRMGVSSQSPVGANWTGALFACSAGIPAALALQMDRNVDDGDTSTGSLRALGAQQTIVSLTADAVDVVTICQTF